MNAKRVKINDIKEQLLELLKKEHTFWSYNTDTISLNTISDNQLIAFTMRYLDIDEIKMLFDIYPVSKIKKAWRELLVPEGEYLYTLNRFFAWYYFKAKRPDAYLKSLQTRQLNRLYS